MPLDFASATVHVEDIGVGPAVLLVNGLYNDCTAWRPLVQQLARRHRVVSFDFLNQGRSGSAGLAFGEQAGLLAEVMAHVGLSPRDTVVCGLSAGAALAARLHCDADADADSGFRGLVLMGPNPGTLRGFLAQVLANAIHLLREYGVEAFWRASLQTFYSPAFFERHAGIHELMVEMLSGSQGTTRERLLALLEGDLRMLDTPPATTFLCPVLLLAGSADALFPAAEVAQYGRRCSAPWIACGDVAGGHAFPFENPAGTAAAIAGFLDNCSHLSSATACSPS
jgi:pimeloyl-ACP methyl ester carboxylesterase